MSRRSKSSTISKLWFTGERVFQMNKHANLLTWSLLVYSPVTWSCKKNNTQIYKHLRVIDIMDDFAGNLDMKWIRYVSFFISRLFIRPMVTKCQEMLVWIFKTKKIFGPIVFFLFFQFSQLIILEKLIDFPFKQRYIYIDKLFVHFIFFNIIKNKEKKIRTLHGVWLWPEDIGFCKKQRKLQTSRTFEIPKALNN